MHRLTTAFVSLILFVATGCSHVSSTGQGAATGGGVTRGAKTGAFVKPVSFSILQDYIKGEDLRQVAMDFQLMKELGVTTWRGSFPWGDYEPVRGTYDLEWLHQFADLAAREEMKLRPYLGYTAPWAAKGGADQEAWNDPPARIGDWTRFVTSLTTAMARHGNILSYEIYNEENVKQWWDGSAGEYNAVLKEAATAIRKTAPQKQIIFGGMVYPDADWVKDACEKYGNGGNFDILPFHAYPETWTPKEISVENFLDQGYPGHFRNTFVPWADEFCGRKAIWINEAGYSTSPGKSETDQANWWARALATFLANPRVEHIGIYQIKERKKSETVIGDAENYYLGITRPDRTRKMAFFTLKRLLSLLNVGTLTVADADLKVEVTAGAKGQLYHHLFVRPDGRQILFVWDKRNAPTLRITTRPGTGAIEYALDGAGSPYGSFTGKVLDKVKLTPGMVRIFEITPPGRR